MPVSEFSNGVVGFGFGFGFGFSDHPMYRSPDHPISQERFHLKISQPRI
jgi:hypothetical protein